MNRYIDRVNEFLIRVETACTKAGRDINEVQVIAASKTQSNEAIEEVYKLDITSFGENKAQELIAKADFIKSPIDWHFIGQIQTNKLKKIASRVSHIHSVDKKKQLEIIASSPSKPNILLQLSADGNPQRGGVTFDNLEPLLSHAQNLGLSVVGIMHVPPPGQNSARFFDLAKQTADKLGLKELSIGMSGDFEEAIARGATMIRVGSVLFGPRSYE